ncbi:MAG: alanine--tRNA ligase-related protein [Methylocystis sp.]
MPQLLGAKEPLMWKLAPTLVAEMGQAYPELVRAQALIADTLLSEETRFARRSPAASPSSTRRPRRWEGGQAFRRNRVQALRHYGFPLDLTEDALRPRGIGVDKESFNAAMDRQREEARKAWAGSGETATEALWFALKERLGATEFLGYETEKSEGVVAAILHDGAETFSLKKGARGALILQSDALLRQNRADRSATSARCARGVRFRVENTLKKLGDLIVHEGVVGRRRNRARNRARTRCRSRSAQTDARQSFGHAYPA